MDSSKARDRLSGPVRSQEGFALAVAILALVLVAAVVASGFFTASQETRIGLGMKSMTAAFYAGESGVQQILDEWDPAFYNALDPGDSAILGPRSFEGGSTYRARVVRVDDNTSPRKRYFYVETVGRGFGGVRGERRQAVTARVRFHDICCGAALTITDDSLEMGSNSKVYGVNEDHVDWLNAGACTGYATDDLPGIQAPDLSKLNTTSGDVQGNPPLVEDGTLAPSDIFVFDDLLYDEIAKLADHKFPDGASISSADPVVTNGECDRSVATNWGEPDTPGHACFDYFPILHALGDISISGNDNGQGILLVDGDMEIAGQFSFYGIVLVRGSINVSGRGTLAGGVLVRGTGPSYSETRAPNARIQLSQCAVERAERLSALAKGRLLARRSWVDLF